MSDSRISGFYRLSVRQRIDELERRGWLRAADAELLRGGHHLLSLRAADRMIENVIATFALPLAVAPNFRVNGRDYVVPLVVEEPSIVAALSAAAKLARDAGGFEAEIEESLAIGQVHVTGADDPDAAAETIRGAAHHLLHAANRVHPRLIARGGGAREVEVRVVTLDDGRRVLAVHVLVDTGDAMGANLVNTICEAVAPEIARISGGSVAMRILSNLGDRAVVRASVRYRLADLDPDGAAAAAARDAIVLAADIAQADSYRAVTHNKGILNGIDPLAIATGNDWRAIEAGAHAFAAAGGRYTALSEWAVESDGGLRGDIRLPLKVGIVGGTLASNPGARLGLALANVATSAELAGLMAAAGLAANFAAIRALATTGIQRGHMRLHARSVALAAGAPDALFDDVVAGLIESGDVKDWKARELLAAHAADAVPGERAAGKVILFGEHAVVYGRHALALPIPDAVSARAEHADESAISIPAWHVAERLAPESDFHEALNLIARELGIDAAEPYMVHVEAGLPRAMGLGSSAALAVAVTRALAALFDIRIEDDRVNAIAFECEKLAHGTPSGIDNALATYARPLLFRRTTTLELETIDLAEPPPIVIGCSTTPGSTLAEVAAVRERRTRARAHYDAIFDAIDELALAGASALSRADYVTLGEQMNVCHGLLNAIGVSTPELENMVAIARAAGATGAKLTGAGGGGSIVAMCPGTVDDVTAALESGGFGTIKLGDV